MSKREIVLSLLSPNTSTPYTPAAFFLHFDPVYHRGQAAVDKHLEYFSYTGMDLVKIQYENQFPIRPEITRPEDWENIPCYGPDFYEDQWNIAKGLVDATKKDALVVMTLYSPFMCARDSVGKHVFFEHLKENPEKARKGIEIITESLMIFIKGCIERGIDGFYHSTQGGESHRFGKSMTILASLLQLMTYFVWTGAQMVAAGTIVNALFPAVPVEVGMILVAVWVTGYTMMGGMLADTLLDFIQMFFTAGGVLLIFLFVLNEVGGWNGLVGIQETLYSSKPFTLLPDMQGETGYLGYFGSMG